jgi:Xaa-Pro aminopeptidase
MTAQIKLALSGEEIELLVDALEADMEGYVDAAKEARGNNNRADVQTFTEAATRIQALMARLQALIEDD